MEHIVTKENILEIIIRALENLNSELTDDRKIDVGLDTPLFGPNATLDSLSLVSVIVDVEMDVSDALNKSISLTDDRAMSQEISPFDSVQTLLNYIMTLAKDGS